MRAGELSNASVHLVRPGVVRIPDRYNPSVSSSLCESSSIPGGRVPPVCAISDYVAYLANLPPGYLNASDTTIDNGEHLLDPYWVASRALEFHKSSLSNGC